MLKRKGGSTNMKDTNGIIEKNNPNCPCKKVKCERHGNCVQCREHHNSPKIKYLTTCDRIKKKEEKVSL